MPVAFLLSSQRTGSHFLKSALDSVHGQPRSGVLPYPRSRRLLVLPEILSEANSEYRAREDWTFPAWLRRDAKPRTADEVWGEFRHYLDDLKRRAAKDVALADLKLNQLHAVSGAFQEIGAAPPVLYQLLLAGKIVLLRRRNLVKTVLSGLSAAAANEWHRTAPGRPRPPLRLNAAEFRQFVEQLDHGYGLVDQWLGPYRGFSVHFVDYEDLTTDDGSPRVETLAGIAAFLGLPPGESYASQYRKTGSDDLRAAIANYDEVAAALAGTRYEAMLDPAPAERRAA